MCKCGILHDTEPRNRTFVHRGGGTARQEIVEAAIENFESRKFISGSENSQKRYNYIENMNVVGQRCVAFFRVLFCGKLLIAE